MHSSHSDLAKVPNLDHAASDEWSYVYEPSDDTFLFLDAILADKSFILSRAPNVCVELGCGSGVVITHATSMLLPHPVFSIAIDVNEKASRLTQQTALANSISTVDCVTTDLFNGLEQRLQGKVDLLLFNPPYVPTPSEEVGGRDISAAWAGGVDGREVIDRVLPKINGLLSPGGVLYMVVVEENKPISIAKQLAPEGFTTVRVLKRKAQNETLSILRISRKTTVR